jgi:hypothetical protein
MESSSVKIHISNSVHMTNDGVGNTSPSTKYTDTDTRVNAKCQSSKSNWNSGMMEKWNDGINAKNPNNK